MNNTATIKFAAPWTNTPGGQRRSISEIDIPNERVRFTIETKGGEVLPGSLMKRTPEQLKALVEFCETQGFERVQ